MLELKKIDQRWDPDEYWIYQDEEVLADTNVFLEYYLTKSINIYEKYKPAFKLKRHQYSLEVFTEFKRVTEDGRKFDRESYISWMKSNEAKTLMESILEKVSPSSYT